MRNRLLVGVCQRLPHAADCPAWTPCELFIRARRTDFIDDRLLSEVRVYVARIFEQTFSIGLLVRRIESIWNTFPLCEVSMSRNHHCAEAGRRTLCIAGRGYG